MKLVRRFSQNGVEWRCDDEGVWCCADYSPCGVVLFSIYPRHSHKYVLYRGYLKDEIDTYSTFCGALEAGDNWVRRCNDWQSEIK